MVARSWSSSLSSSATWSYSLHCALMDKDTLLSRCWQTYRMKGVLASYPVEGDSGQELSSKGVGTLQELREEWVGEIVKKIAMCNIFCNRKSTWKSGATKEEMATWSKRYQNGSSDYLLPLSSRRENTSHRYILLETN